MKKIVLLPLDERPCNFKFPYKLYHCDDFRIIRPDKLGDMKTPANPFEIRDFLTESCRDADVLVLSIDTLLYGGLIPSRLHFLTEEELLSRLDIIKMIKVENPQIKIYAFNCIMRCPTYSDSIEEPDYYDICGAEIHKIGVEEHKMKLGMGDQEKLDSLYQAVKPEYLEDYRKRRTVNLAMNLHTLDYLREGILDFLIIPQDDSAPYGFTAMDQVVVRDKITSELLQDQVLMYPGADEVSMTLLARVINELHNAVPTVYIKYASVHAPFLIPAYEDRSLGETLKYHIMAAGCRQVASPLEADLILAVSAPANVTLEANEQPAKNHNYSVERNLTEFVLSIEQYIKEGKKVTVGDNAFVNGADLELVALLNKRGIMMKLAGYAGWNTSSNTVGTALSQGIRYLYYGECKMHKDFLAARFVEDAGYCATVRDYLTVNKLPALGMTYANVKEKEGVASKLVEEMLQEFIKNKLTSISDEVVLHSVSMPWRRMFEVDIDVTYEK